MPDGVPTEDSRPATAEATAAKPQVHAQERQGGPGEKVMSATLKGAVAKHEEPTSILSRLAGRETGPTQPHLLKDAHVQKMRGIGVKEGVGKLRANIGEDPRFQKILEEEGTQDDDAKMRALDKFSAQYPKEAKHYERHSIWHGEGDRPDVRNDLYYNRLYRQAEATQRDKQNRCMLNLTNASR